VRHSTGVTKCRVCFRNGRFQDRHNGYVPRHDTQVGDGRSFSEEASSTTFITAAAAAAGTRRSASCTGQTTTQPEERYFAMITPFHYRPRSGGDNTFGGVRVCVCPSVCVWALFCLNRLTFDHDFGHEGRPWPWLAWDCRSKVKVKQWKLFTLSRLNQWCGAGRY